MLAMKASCWKMSSGWMRQKKPSVSTTPVIRNCSRKVPLAPPELRSGTTVNRIAEVTRQRPASQKKRPCQLMIDSDHWIGSVAAIDPRPPAIIWKPVMSPQRSGGYQSVMALMAAISPPAKPRPISTRATISSPSERLRPNSAAPTAAMASRMACTRRGP